MDLQSYLDQHKEPLRPRVTCFLVNGNKILLGQKLDGIGEGNLVGIGGKVKPGEERNDTVVRELQEEIFVTPLDFVEIADLDFYFVETPEWNQKIYMYLCTRWEGVPKETEEIIPKWFDKAEIPFEKMWDDARYYMPHILNDRYVKADFLYDANNIVIDSRLRISSPNIK